MQAAYGGGQTVFNGMDSNLWSTLVPQVATERSEPRPRGKPPVLTALLDPSANNAYVVAMATLNIRNLSDEVHRRLRVRAAEHGRSMEAEARAILAAALTDEESLGRTKESTAAKVRELRAFIDQLYGGNKPKNAVDDLIAERHRAFAREEAE
jgi:antitoxin FitA